MTDYAYKDIDHFEWPISMRSKWRGVGAWHKLTDYQRSEYGWYPVEYINEEYDPETQHREVTSESLVNNVYVVNYTIVDITLDDHKSRAMKTINNIRYSRSTKDIPFTVVLTEHLFIENTEQILELKQAVNDIKNGIATFLEATGGYWRDNENNNVSLTESEFFDLSRTVTLYVAGLGRESHIVKSGISSASSKPAIDSIIDSYKIYNPLIS